MTQQTNDPQRVVIQRARFSYVHLTSPRAPLNGVGVAKFSVTILLPKSDIAAKQAIDMAIQAATVAGIPGKWGGVKPPRVEIPLCDGDGVRPSGESFGPECKGHWVFTASGERRPEVIDENFNPIIDASQIYSGMYGQISIRFFAYMAAGKKGIGCGIGNVRKTADGEPLAASGPSAAEEFGGSYNVQPQQQPVYQPQPQGYYAPPQQPAYQPQPAYQQPPQPPYQAPVNQPVQQPVYQPQPVQQPQAIDPITGRPITGSVMGL